MLGGTRPIPTRLQIVRGNPRKQNLNAKLASEPQPSIVATVPIPPRILNGNKVARDHWKEYAKELHSIGLLTKIDMWEFTRYCLTYSQYVEALKEVNQDSMVIVNDLGNKIINPWTKIMDQKSKELRQFESDFGLNPSARTRVQTGNLPKKDAFEEFMTSK